MTDSRTIKTTVELGGEGTYSQKLRQISGGLKNVDSQMKILDATYAKDDKNLAALTARYGAYQDKLELQKRRLEAIRQEYERVVRAEGENSQSAQRLAAQYNNASAQAARTERQIEELSADMNAAAREAGSLAGALGVSNAQLKEMGEKAEAAAGKAAKLLGTATATVVGISAKGFMTFEQEMSNVETLADTSLLSMQAMSAQALAASDETRVAADQIAKGAYMALSAGVDTANAIGFVTDAAKAAKAGQADLTTVVDGSTSAMNAWKIACTDAATVFGKMLIAQDLGKTTLGEIAGSIGEVTGLAPQLGISLDEVLAATAALTKNGVQTSGAFTGMKAVMSAVLKPTAEAAKTAQELGLEFNAAALQAKGLTGFLADVMEKTGGSEEKLAALFGSVEGLSQIMLLGSAAAGDYNAALEAMSGGIGRLDEAFAIVSDNSASRLEGSLNRLKNNAIRFGSTLAPYIDMGAAALGNLSGAIGQLSEEEQKGILQTALWVTGALGVVSVGSKVASALSMMASPAGMAMLGLAGVAAAFINIRRAIDNSGYEAAMGRLDDALNANVDGTMTAIVHADLNATPAQNEIDAALEELRLRLSQGYDRIEADLTDGQYDSPEVVASLKTEAGDNFADTSAQIDAYEEAAVAALDPQGADYAAQCEEIRTHAEGLRTDLQAIETETVAFIESMAGKSAEYVRAHMDELDALEKRAQEVVAEVDGANDKLMASYNADYETVRRGGTTDQSMIAGGVQFAYQTYQQDLAAIDAQYQADLASAQQKFISGMLTEDEHLRVQDLLGQSAEADRQAAKEAYGQRMAALVDGVVEAYEATEPEMTAAVIRIMDLMDADAQLAAAAERLRSADGTESPEAREKLRTIVERMYADLFGEEIEINPGTEGQWAHALLGRIAEDLEAGLNDQSLVKDGGLLDTVKEMLYTGVLDDLGFDSSDPNSPYRILGGGLGESVAQGMVESIDAGAENVNASTKALGEGMIDTMETTLDSHSPSRVFIGIGQNAADGLIIGMEGRKGALIAKARQLAQLMAAEMRRGLDIHSPSRVFRRIGQQVDEGLLLGVADKADQVDRAMRRMAAYGQSEGAQNISTTYGAPVYNYTFRGSKITGENDAKRILLETNRLKTSAAQGYGIRTRRL